MDAIFLLFLRGDVALKRLLSMRSGIQTKPRITGGFESRYQVTPRCWRKWNIPFLLFLLSLFYFYFCKLVFTIFSFLWELTLKDCGFFFFNNCPPETCRRLLCFSPPLDESKWPQLFSLFRSTFSSRLKVDKVQRKWKELLKFSFAALLCAASVCWGFFPSSLCWICSQEPCLSYFFF